MNSTRRDHAEMVMPVGRVRRLLREGQRGTRISKTAPIYLAAILEHLAEQLLMAADKEAGGEHKIIITSDHIKFSLQHHGHLRAIAANVHIL